jgi:hypothetical protein
VQKVQGEDQNPHSFGPLLSDITIEAETHRERGRDVLSGTPQGCTSGSCEVIKALHPLFTKN